MNDLRTAAQQALEALYQAKEFTELYDTEHAAAVNERCHENITALRAALAEDALDRLAENERALGIQMEAPRAALAQQAEPVEPVAWSHNLIDNIITHRPADIDRRPDRWTPLCKCADTPPQRKPLTEEEIDHIDACIDKFTPLREGKRLFARAVERALEEKNRGR